MMLIDMSVAEKVVAGNLYYNHILWFSRSKSVPRGTCLPRDKHRKKTQRMYKRLLMYCFFQVICSRCLVSQRCFLDSSSGAC